MASGRDVWWWSLICSTPWLTSGSACKAMIDDDRELIARAALCVVVPTLAAMEGIIDRQGDQALKRFAEASEDRMQI